MDSKELKVEIALADYKKIAKEVKKREVSVSDKEVEQAVCQLCKSRAKFSQVRRPARKGDFVQIEYEYRTAMRDSPRTGQEEPGRGGSSAVKDSFILGEAGFMSGFENNLEGLESGDEKEFSLSSPQAVGSRPSVRADDYGDDEDRRDKDKSRMNFRVKMISVQKVDLPEINDGFARELGRFKDLSELRGSVKRGIREEKETAERQRMRGEILERVSGASEFDIPDPLIKAERNRALEALKLNLNQTLKISFQDYLKKLGITEKVVSDGLWVQAQKRIKNSLVLNEIAKKENIRAEEREITLALNDVLKRRPDMETAKKKIDIDKLKTYIEENIKNEKTLAKLENFAR